MYVYGVELRVAAVEVSTSGVAEGGWVVGVAYTVIGGKGKKEKKEKRKKKVHQLLKVGKRVRAGATNYGRCGL